MAEEKKDNRFIDAYIPNVGAENVQIPLKAPESDFGANDDNAVMRNQVGSASNIEPPKKYPMDIQLSNKVTGGLPQRIGDQQKQEAANMQGGLPTGTIKNPYGSDLDQYYLQEIKRNADAQKEFSNQLKSIAAPYEKQAQFLEKEANKINLKASEQEMKAKEYQDDMNNLISQVKADNQKILDTPIDPRRLYGNQGVAGGILLGLSTFLAGLGGGTNQVLQMINESIDRDINAQKEQHDSLRGNIDNAYKMFKLQYPEDPELAMKIYHNQYVQTMLNSLAAKTQSSEAKLRHQELSQKYADQRSKLLKDLLTSRSNNFFKEKELQLKMLKESNEKEDKDKTAIRTNRALLDRASTAMMGIRNLRGLIKQEGTSGLPQDLFGFVGARQPGKLMKADIKALATDFAKLTDPESTVREGERQFWEDYFDIGFFTSSATANELLDKATSILARKIINRKTEYLPGDVRSRLSEKELMSMFQTLHKTQKETRKALK